jgi:DNA-binding FadR family transcriptional regulator
MACHDVAFELLEGLRSYRRPLRFCDVYTEDDLAVIKADHRRILDAIANGDEQAAQTAMREHFARGAHELRQRLDEAASGRAGGSGLRGTPGRRSA